MQIMLASKFEDVLKAASAVHSFVIDEVALADLLQRAWKSPKAEIIEHISGVLDLETGKFNADKSFEVTMWLSGDSFKASMEKAWEAYEDAARAHLEKAYDRGWLEEGAGPLANRKKKKKLVLSEEQKKEKKKVVSNLLEGTRSLFVDYVKDTVVPKILETVSGLRRIESAAHEMAQKAAKQELTEDFILQAELARKLRVAAVEKARRKMLDELQSVLEKNEGGNLAANLMASRAHHFGFVDWAEANSIVYYAVSSVLDDRTCVHCESMDGRVFTVSDAKKFRDNYILAANDPQLLKDNSPFLTKQGLKYMAGEVNLSEFVKKSADGSLAKEKRFYFPPFHPNCRCTVAAVKDIEAYAQSVAEDRPELLKPYDTSDALPLKDRFALDLSPGKKNIPDPPRDFNEFSTIEDAKSYFSTYFPDMKIDLSGVADKSGARALSQLERLRRVYPELITGDLIVNTEAALPEFMQEEIVESLAWTWQLDNSLGLNTKFFGDDDALRIAVKRLKKIGHAIETSAGVAEQIVTHEVGHLAYNALNSELTDRIDELFDSYEGVLARKVSGYAATEPKEFAAESFAKLYLTNSTNSVLKKMRAIFEEGGIVFPVKKSQAQKSAESVARRFMLKRSIEAKREFTKSQSPVRNIVDLARKTLENRRSRQ